MQSIIMNSFIDLTYLVMWQDANFYVCVIIVDMFLLVINVERWRVRLK